jgi:hypothetical protein
VRRRNFYQCLLPLLTSSTAKSYPFASSRRTTPAGFGKQSPDFDDSSFARNCITCEERCVQKHTHTHVTMCAAAADASRHETG